MNTTDWYSFSTRKAGKLTVSLTVPAVSTFEPRSRCSTARARSRRREKAGTNLVASFKDHDLPAGNYYLRVKSFGFEKGAHRPRQGRPR